MYEEPWCPPIGTVLRWKGRWAQGHDNWINFCASPAGDECEDTEDNVPVGSIAVVQAHDAAGLSPVRLLHLHNLRTSIGWGAAGRDCWEIVEDGDVQEG